MQDASEGWTPSPPLRPRLLPDIMPIKPRLTCAPSQTRPPLNTRPLPEANGINEVFAITQALEASGITCCLVGTSALIYYGARRGRSDWEICVPTEFLDRAVEVLTSTHQGGRWAVADLLSTIQPGSLCHTYPRLTCENVQLFFRLVPSKDCHISCTTENIQRSFNNLPYPKLALLMQALLDTNDFVALADLVDGSDVTEEWGEENLDLSGTNDTDWVKWKNNEIAKSGSFFGVASKVCLRREVFQDTIRTKRHRVGYQTYPHLFATLYRLHNSTDPWLEFSPFT